MHSFVAKNSSLQGSSNFSTKMAKFILGKKMMMTQIFDKDGQAMPVTLVQAGPCWVAQIKTKEKDGYQAAQIGFEKQAEKKSKRPQIGHFKKAQTDCFKYSREFEIEENSSLKPGDEIKVDIFKEGDSVMIIGTSKGKGFAGVVKRHHFGGGPASHGQKHSLRAPGSIGATFPERVPKGRRMAGRMGGERVTVQGLTIVAVDNEENILAIRGALPGLRGSLLAIVREK